MRVAVVGIGNMGQNHMRIYSQLRNVTLVGLVDPNPERAQAMAARYGCRIFQGVDELVGQVDAVTIASPSTMHAEIGRYLLTNGIHCLIEKPLATTEADCQALIEAAEGSGAILMVGHIERYNPAIEQLSTLLSADCTVHALDARRMSATSARIGDVDVIMDLMVHDLDIALNLREHRQVPVRIQAEGVQLGDGGLDYVTAMVRFDSGLIASFTASRITQNKVRELQLSTEMGYIQADYIRQELHIFRQSSIAPLPDSHGSHKLDLSVDRLMVRHAEPLAQELLHFVDCVANGIPPRTGGEDALRTLRLAWDIQAAVGSGNSIRRDHA